MHPDIKKRTLKVRNYALLWVTITWWVMLYFSQVTIDVIVYVGLLFVPLVLMVIYLKYKRKMTFIYHLVFSIASGILVPFILQQYQMSILPQGYLIYWLFSLVLIMITYAIFSMGLTKNDVTKMVSFIGVSFILWPIVVLVVIRAFGDFVGNDLAYLAFFGLSGWLVTSPYLIAVGLSFKPKWFYQSALNAPFFIPLYLIFTFFFHIFAGSGFMSWRDFLDLTIEDKRIDA